MRRSFRSGVSKWILLLALGGAGCLLFALPGRQGSGHEDDEQTPKKSIQVRKQPVDVLLTLAIKDKQQLPWKGQVELSEGKIVDLRIIRASQNSTVDNPKFNVRAIRAANQGGAQRRAARRAANANPADSQPAPARRQAALPPLAPAQLKLILDAPPEATLKITCDRGDFSTSLADLPLGERRLFLDGHAAMEREEAATPLTNGDTEDDFPALVAGRNHDAWLAYVAYKPGSPLVVDRVLRGEFDALVPRGNGDQIRLMHFDGKTWSPWQAVTEKGGDVWRPAVTLDGRGRLWIVWAEKVDDDWDLFARRYEPGDGGAEGTWSKIDRLTKSPGADINVALATDSRGRVWAAWQGWRDGNYEVLLASADDQGEWSKPRKLSTSKANDWSPAIAADGQGKVYIAWDTYDRGNYDVLLAEAGSDEAPRPIAASARFEARPSLVCDRDNRLWIAYDEGDEQWGKDFSTNEFSKIGFKKNPGFALYINRTARVKCLADGKLMQPKGSLDAALSGKLKFNKTLPRLAFDGAGGLWLLMRHRPPGNGNGEVWNSFAVRYDGREWSEPRALASSANLMDNRPGMAAGQGGLLVVYSGDGRTRTQDREQDDLYAAVLKSDAHVASPELIDDTPPPAAEIPVVHPNETEDVGKMRNFRVKIGGQDLRLVRGDFHRHTELSAHRDADGLLEDSLRYGLDGARHDWMGNGDHDNGLGHEYMWWLVQKTFDMHTHPPHFVGAMSYERSVVFPNGHRNVIMPRRGIRPLPRGELPGTAEEGTPDTKMLYAYLKHFGGMCASHTSGTNMGTDWRDNDPSVEPVVEIYQGHRHNYEHFGAPRSATPETQIGGYQPAGFIWNALEKGYRLGFESSSDHISTHLSYACVFVDELSRPGIIAGMKKRHSYAATDNILLVVRSGEHLMGDEFETSDKPSISIEVEGTAPVAKLHVVRDNKYVYTAEPNERKVRRTFTDSDVKPGQSSYYYVRVEQADGNLAWASPMWITYKAK